jgi:hypothetical protein
VSKGFVLWDIIQSCSRIGSLDNNIKKEIPNDIHSFCNKFPTIRRIIKYNKEWFATGQLQPHPDHTGSQTQFKKICQKNNGKQKQNCCVNDKSSRENAVQDGNGIKNVIASQHIIHLVSAISVSPAAAAYSYEEKRDFWEKFVYQPGLEDFKNAALSSYFAKN